MKKRLFPLFLSLLLALCLGGQALAETAMVFTADEFTMDRLDAMIDGTNAYLTSRINALYAAHRDALAQKGFDAPAYVYALDFQGFSDNMGLIEEMNMAQTAEEAATLLGGAYVQPAAEAPEDVAAAFAEIAQRAGLSLPGGAYYSQPADDPTAAWQLLSCADATAEDIQAGLVPYLLIKLDDALQLTYMVTGQMYDPVEAGEADEATIQTAIDTAEAFLAQGGTAFTRGTGEARTSANLYRSLDGEAFLWVWIPDDTAERLGDTQQQYGARFAVGVETGAVLDMLLDVPSELVMA